MAARAAKSGATSITSVSPSARAIAVRKGWASDGRDWARFAMAATMAAGSDTAATGAGDAAGVGDGRGVDGLGGAGVTPEARRSTRATSSAKGASRRSWTIFKSASSSVTRGSWARRRSVSAWVSTSKTRR